MSEEFLYYSKTFLSCLTHWQSHSFSSYTNVNLESSLFHPNVQSEIKN